MDPTGEEAGARHAFRAGLQHQEAGRLPEAEAAYRQALGIKADYFEAHNNLANVLIAQGRVFQAEQHFRRALALQPNSGQVHANLGRALATLARRDEAEAFLRRAVELEPRGAVAFNDLGYLLLQRGALEEAERCFGAALQLAPGLSVAALNLRDVSLAKKLWTSLEYCPTGWDESRLALAPPGWDAESVVETTRASNEELYKLHGQGIPFGSRHHLALNATFAYVLARVAGGARGISVLDWGGGLGHYYHVARMALPELELEFHCKETGVLATAGRKAVPEIHWHADDSCLHRKYDLVVVSGSLQYAREWKGALSQLAGAASRWFFLTRAPVVNYAPTFAAIQRVYGSTMLHWYFNRTELLESVRALRFDNACEFMTLERPYCGNAPEQGEMRGWLFRRKAAGAS